MALLRRLVELSNPTTRVSTQPTSDQPPAPPAGLRRAMPVIPDNYIKETLLRKDTEPQQSRLNHPGYTHVSSLINICVRQYVLAGRYEVQAVERVTGGHRVMWKMGRAIEDHVRSQFIEGQGRTGIYGVWKCKCGNINHLGMFPSRTCNSCGTEATRYFEPVLHDEENKIVGSPDITFLVGRFYFVPVEIKSMNKADWDALEAPLPDHVAQAAMYRRLYQRKGFTVHDNVKFIYVTKDFKYGDPYKEFQVDCTEPLIVSMVEGMEAAAHSIKVSNEQRLLPPRSVCRSATNSRAKSCPCAHLCFSLGQENASGS